MTIRHTICLIATLAAMTACVRGTRSTKAEPAEHHEHAPVENAATLGHDAVCVLHSTSGSQTAGVIRFRQQDEVVVITVAVSGLLPGSKHAMHIHELGDVRAADGASVGGHYNPEGHDHGGPGSKQHHAGDLGNIAADGAGEARVELRVEGLDFTDILGRSVVVHAHEDDFVTQPSGNAGPRIAVGVIGLAKSE